MLIRVVIIIIINNNNNNDNDICDGIIFSLVYFIVGMAGSLETYFAKWRLHLKC